MSDESDVDYPTRAELASIGYSAPLAAENARLRAIVEAAKPVLFHVSRGRRAAFIDVYPDAAARRALGLFNEWEASRV